jgi:dienelactone hydrolase
MNAAPQIPSSLHQAQHRGSTLTNRPPPASNLAIGRPIPSTIPMDPQLPLPLLMLALCLSHAAAEPAPAWPILVAPTQAAPLPNTRQLELEGDIGRQMVSANGAFLDAALKANPSRRALFWPPHADAPEDRRALLARLLGLHRDARVADPQLEFYGDSPGPIARSAQVEIFRVRWPAIEGVDGEGLLLLPGGEVILADVIAIPEASQSPEQISAICPLELASPTSPFALQLAAAGCRVLVPTLIHRLADEHKMSGREWRHRPAFTLGRHLLGYELHRVLSAASALQNSPAKLPDLSPTPRPLGLVGWGEGGLLALYAAALDQGFAATCVAGYFGPRESLWLEPAERNVFGLLETFGDAEIASLVAPRHLLVEHGRHPTFVFRPGADGTPEILDARATLNGKPGRLPMPSPAQEQAEWDRLLALAPPGWQHHSWLDNSGHQALAPSTLSALLSALDLDPSSLPHQPAPPTPLASAEQLARQIAGRQARQSSQLGQHSTHALTNAALDRHRYFKDLDSSDLAAFENTIEPYRERFRREVIGDFALPLLPPDARTRPHLEGPLTISYEVVLDVMEQDGAKVFAYGILTLPKDLDLSSGERRPVVVCQHGLEGSPHDLVGEQAHAAYKAFATRLAERGFITFAPQNGYAHFDLFRMQQFKAQSLGKTLFSLIVPQHRQLVSWLAGLPFVDPARIAFYGLSYGGKSAMRIPPLVPGYCLSICSADFNDWVWKNAATDPASLQYSYANKNEYEIFEWDLGGTFNYAEMAALICPRPFMVERGHFDGVAPDERVAFEFAKVRHLYQARLGIGDRCEIAYFVGPHSIDGTASFDFLHRHLQFPAPPAN